MKNQMKTAKNIVIAFLLVIVMVIPMMLPYTTQVVHAEEEVVGVTYYVDSENGSDENCGKLVSKPWKTLDNVNANVENFKAGDKILLKKGSIFNNQVIYLSGLKGTQEAPIMISSYGEEGNMPVINANGGEFVNQITGEAYPYLMDKVSMPDNRTVVEVKSRAAVLIRNCEYIEIDGIEVTNFVGNPDENSEKNLVGICLQNINGGVLNHNYIRNSYVHDVNSKVYDSRSTIKGHGGIVTRVDIPAEVDEDGTIKEGVPSSWNDLKIEDNRLYNVSREGIYMHSDWMKRLERGDATVDVNNLKHRPFKASTNVSISRNNLENIAGDGIVLIGVDGGEDKTGALVEGNLSANANMRNRNNDLAHAAIWVWNSDNTLFQYNEAYGTNCTRDGQAFDFDFGVNDSLLQYNYSHDNEGGFLLVCACAGGTSSTLNSVARYNISVNDAAAAGSRLVHLAGGNMTVDLYNNTFYYDEKTPKAVYDEGQFTNQRKVRFTNNIFYDASLRTEGKLFDKKTTSVEYNGNCYYGLYPVEDEKALLADPRFENPGQDAIGIESPTGYKLKADSPCIDSAIDMQGTSLGSITNPGTRDYFGTPLVDGGCDMGAVEFVGEKEAPIVEKPEIDIPVDEITQPSIINQNPSFEEGTNGWYVTDNSNVEVVEENAYNGKKSLYVHNGAAIERGLVGDADLELTLEPNTQYRASAWVRSKDGSAVRFGVKKYISNNDAIGENKQVVDVTDTEWTLCDFLFTTGPEWTNANVFFYDFSNSTGGYVDDIVVEKVNSVLNASFEDDLTSWMQTNQSNTSISTDAPQDGSKAVYVKNGASIEQGLKTGAGNIVLEPKTDYIASAWLKSAAGSEMRFGVKFFGDGSSTINTDRKFVNSKSTEWTKVEIEFTTGENIKGTNLFAFNSESSATGGYIDNICIARKNPTKVIIPEESVVDDTDKLVPRVPGALNINKITNSSVIISWKASTDNVGVVGYRIYLNGELLEETEELSRRFDDLELDQTYEVAVSAFDEAGNESGKASVTFTTVKVNLKELQTAITKAKTYEEDLYTADSFAKMKLALAEAEKLVVTEEVLQTEVDEATEKLNQAIDNLKKKPDNKYKLGWNQNDKGWWYVTNATTGSYYKNGWTIINKSWFYFEANGYMKTGWQRINNKWYYLGTKNDGVMKAGWQKISNKWYYLGDKNDGAMKTSWQKISGKWYYLGAKNDGAMKTSWQKISGKWYYLGAKNDGAMKTGWQKIGSKWYYLGTKDNGAMKTSWQKISGKWYYLGAKDDGAMKTSWQKISGKWYYLGTKNDGAMKTGWQKINNRWYYFYENGVMAENVWIHKYYLNNSGIWVKTR